MRFTSSRLVASMPFALGLPLEQRQSTGTVSFAEVEFICELATGPAAPFLPLPICSELSSLNPLNDIPISSLGSLAGLGGLTGLLGLLGGIDGVTGGLGGLTGGLTGGLKIREDSTLVLDAGRLIVVREDGIEGQEMKVKEKKGLLASLGNLPGLSILTGLLGGLSGSGSSSLPLVGGLLGGLR